MFISLLRFAVTYSSDRDVLGARVSQELGNGALLLELKVHLRLVRLDLDKHVAGGY